MATEISWCPRNRIIDLQDFIRNYWSDEHVFVRDATVLEWQHRWTANPDFLSVIIAEDQKKLVAMLGIMPCEFSVHGIRLRAKWGAIWLTIPEYRKRPGISIRVLRKGMVNDQEIGALQAANEIAMPIYKRMGYFAIDEVPRWWRILSPAALKRLYKFGGSESPNLPLPDAPATTFSPAVHLLEWGAVEDRWDAAWESQFAPTLIGTWRDREYLTWRYIEHPSFTYQLLFAEEAGEITGMLCYRLAEIRDCPERVLRIVEYLTVTTEAARALASVAVRIGIKEDAAFADFYCTGLRFGEPLEEFGFSREPSGLPCLFQPLDLNERPLNAAFHSTEVNFDSPDLYVTRSDGDQDRPN